MNLGGEAAGRYGRSTPRRLQWLLGVVCGTLILSMAVCAQSVGSRGTLDQRVQALTRALALDARQQIQLQTILNEQRLAVMKIWSESALPAAERGPATRAVEDRTADRIRGILTEEQKKRYNPPKPGGAPTAPPNVGDWMKVQAGRSEQP